MSGFQVRDIKAVKTDLSSVAAEGRQDVTLTKVEVARSKSSGNPQMIFTSTVDNGESVGEEIQDRFTFAGGFAEDIAWTRLKNICDSAGYEYESANSLQAFAMSFPLNTLRYSIDVEHRYVVEAWIDTESPHKYTKFTAEQTEETPYKKEIAVQKHEFEAWEGNKKGPYAQPRDDIYDLANVYGPPQNPAELTFTDDGVDEELEGVLDNGEGDLF